MLLPIVKQVISKYTPEQKLWDNNLYNGPQVILLDGPLGRSQLLSIANSLSRILQYNFPGIEASVVDAKDSIELDFVAYRVISNCRKDLVSIVCCADVQALQLHMKSIGFAGKVKSILLYDNLDDFLASNIVPLLDGSSGSGDNDDYNYDKIYNAIDNYSKYFNVTKTLRYNTLFAHTVDDLEGVDKRCFQRYTFLPTSNSSYYFVSRLRKLITSAAKNAFCKWVYFSPKLKYSVSIAKSGRSSDAVANEVLAKISSPNFYTPMQLFGDLNLPSFPGQ